MGVCISKEVRYQAEKSKQIDMELENMKGKEKIIRLLLLGPGGCGKSTILKQLIILHTEGFSVFEMQEKRRIIYLNVIDSMRILIEAMQQLEIQYETFGVNNEIEIVMEVIKNSTETEDISPKLRQALETLWADDGIQKCYRRRNELELEECAKYFLDDLGRISDPGYIPTNQDILHSRMRTSGIVEVTFLADGFPFKVFDVGGQKSERRKWIHLFDLVNAVIFISALSDYDIITKESEKPMNRLISTLNLFVSIVHSLWFSEKPVILFLNKKDVFEEKLPYSSLCKYIPQYEGPSSYVPAYKYIEKRFVDLAKKKPKKQFTEVADRDCYSHATCATDTNQVEHIIQSVLDLVIQLNMSKSGVE